MLVGLVGCKGEQPKSVINSKKEYSSISELFEDRGYLMKEWNEEDCKELVRLYNDGQELNQKEITNFVYDYKSLSSECKEIVKNVYDAEKLKEDERIKKFKEEDGKKTEEFNIEYPNVPYAEVKDDKVVEQAKTIVISKINETMNIKDEFEVVDASTTKMTIEVVNFDFTNGAAVAVQNIIFDAYKEAGLARGVNYTIPITAIVKCGNETREATWELGKSPIRKE